MGDDRRREAKRPARSPLESENLRRRMDYQPDWIGNTSNWITSDMKHSNSQGKQAVRSRKERVENRSDKTGRAEKTGTNTAGKQDMNTIIASLRNLEALHKNMDLKMQSGHIELDTKLDRILCEQRDRFEKLEKAQHEADLRWGKYQEDKLMQEERVMKIENQLGEMKIGELKENIHNLQ